MYTWKDQHTDSTPHSSVWVPNALQMFSSDETPDKIKLDVCEENLSFSTKHLFCPEVPGLKIFIRDLHLT